MKRNLVIATMAILVLVGLLVVLSVQGPPPEPRVAVSFLGFTNSLGRVEALFAISNPPYASLGLHSVSLKDASDSSPTNRPRGYFTQARREPFGLSYAISVTTTNEPLRVILKFQQRSGGARRIIEWMRELFGKVTHNEREYFTGNVFFVTNETRINSTRP